MCCICVFSWYLKFCSEPSCSPLKPLILNTMSWHACPSSGKIVNSACSYNLNTKSGWPGPLLFFLHPLSARHSLCEHQRGRQAGRQGIDARTLGWPHGPATCGRVCPLRRTKAAHNGPVRCAGAEGCCWSGVREKHYWLVLEQNSRTG